MEVSGPASVYEGVSAQFQAKVTGGAGQPSVQWSSSDTTVATVDNTGLVRGRSPGSATISAVVGSSAHGAKITVQDDAARPSLTAMTFDPPAVNLAGGNVVMTFTMRAADAESGIGTAQARVSRQGSGGHVHPAHRCTATAPATGTADEGVWQCSITLDRYLPSDRYAANATVTDRAGNASPSRPWTEFSIQGSLPDNTAPVLSSLTFNPDSISVRTQEARLGIHFRASDAEAGIRAIQVFVASPTGGFDMVVLLEQPASGSMRDGTWSWTPLFGLGSPARTFSIKHVDVFDFAGNATSFTAAQLKALGFTTEGKITN